MNKIILSLPKPLLKKYISKHFFDLSVDDFFKVIEKIEIPIYLFDTNDVLNQNSDVLKQALKMNSEAFRYFKQEAFNNECLNILANSQVNIYPADIDKYPILLENDKICEKVVQVFPQIIKKMNVTQITENIISILENLDYTPDKEDFDKSHLFLESEKLLENAIFKNPILILKVKEPSDKLISIALERGYIPKKEHFSTNPYFKTNKSLLQKAFEYDPSIIVFFDEEELDYDTINSARERGFVAEEKDLLENPNLCRLTDIMEDAIKKNPRLITLVSENCYIDYFLVIKTLEKYKITKEDLEKNPAITKNRSLMYHLQEFTLYSAFLSDDEKEKAIQECLKSNQELTTKKLPFLDYKFGAKADIKGLSELLNYLNLPINEDDNIVQQNYLQILDKVVDGIVNIRYIQKKFSFKYPDIVAINDSLIQLFNNVFITKDYVLISKYVSEIYMFIGEMLPIEQIKDEVENLYKIYINNQYIDLSITNKFCNKILNYHRNYFMSEEKNKILGKETKMKITDKKKNIILNGRKLKKVDNLIINRNFQQLGITEEQFQAEIENIKNTILNNKDIKKLGIQIDVSRLDFLSKLFKQEGSLTKIPVSTILDIHNPDVLKFIIKKIEQIKFKYIGNIILSEEELQVQDWETRNLRGLSPTNYVIVDNEKYIQNISKLLVKLDDETLNKILNNKDLIKEIVWLLPFIDITEELDINTFINILVEYDRLKNKISGGLDNQKNIDYMTINLEKIGDLITLANAYSSVDDITIFALGRNVISGVGEHNSSKYLDFYLKMLSRQNGSIPPVSLQTSNYYLDSGSYSDSERLLIGKKPNKDSCIDLLNSAGVGTYNEVLLQESGDVILIRDTQKNLISRILIFRKGNIVQMVSKSGEWFPIDLYKEIANQIIQKAISNNDNIDYVFVNSHSVLPEQRKDYITIKDRRFVNKFSHADFSDYAILLVSKKKLQGFNENELNLDFNVEPKMLYKKTRKKISYSPTETDITRLRALNIVLENDVETKENISRDFEPFYAKDYIKVICGEDWYIAIKKDGSIEELILPLNDPISKAEFDQIKTTLGINAVNVDYNEETENSILDNNVDETSEESIGIKL